MIEKRDERVTRRSGLEAAPMSEGRERQGLVDRARDVGVQVRAASARTMRAVAVGVREVARVANESWWLPDAFTRLFVARGWIAYDDLPVEVMEMAVITAAAEGIDAGEAVLVAAYDENALRAGLDRWRSLRSCPPARMQLLERAVTDHLEGRYYASVMVTLTQLDGVVYNLVNESFYGPHAPSHLLLPGTVAGAPTGLAALSRLFGEGRWTSTSDELAMPYRHGIVHGLDLGFDNPVASAKAWAAFLALRPWAAHVEGGGDPDDWVDPLTQRWAGIRVAGGRLSREMRELREQLALDAETRSPSRLPSSARAKSTARIAAQTTKGKT